MPDESETGLALSPKVADLSSAVAWLRDHDLPVKRIADILKIEKGHVRQLGFRGQWRIRRADVSGFLESPLLPPADPFGPVPDELRRKLGVRPAMDSWTATLYRRERQKLGDLEERVEQLGTEFWSGVRYGLGIHQLRQLLIEIGRPARYERIRLLARIRQLMAETYAHAGWSLSAINEALTSLLLSRTAYHESSDPHDLEQFAKTALLVSQSYLLRQEPHSAAYYLNCHRDARSRIGAALGGEYFRQRGVVAFQFRDDEEARRNFSLAMVVLADTVEYGRLKARHEVLNIGTRQMNLLAPVDVDGSFELLDYMQKTLPPADIHISMNVNWAVACAFSTDSPTAHQNGIRVLDQYRQASVGFGHQATVALLLGLTPALPEKIRPEWVRYALYQNTFRDD
jgi:hypothetical protein